MRMDPELEALGAELQRLGTTVVPHGDHLCLRLPYFTSVRVRLRDGALHFESRFGLATREWALFGSTAVLGGASAWFLAAHGPGALPLAAGFLGVLSAAVNLARLVMSESAITRVQLLRAMQRREAAPPAMIAPAEVHALAAPSPDLAVRQPSLSPSVSE